MLPVVTLTLAKCKTSEKQSEKINLIVYLGHFDFFFKQILIYNYLWLIRLINEQIM